MIIAPASQGPSRSLLHDCEIFVNIRLKLSPAALLAPDPLEGVPGEGARPRARPGLGPGLGAAAEAGHGGGAPAAARLRPELAVLAVGAVQTRLVPSAPPGGNNN